MPQMQLLSIRSSQVHTVQKQSSSAARKSAC